MKVVVVGCGSVGGVIAGTLARAGVDVTPVIRNQALAAVIRREGFRVREFKGAAWSAPSPRAPVKALTPGAGYDLAIMAVPNPALESCLRETAPALKPDAPFVLCQNGLPEERARRVVGDRVLGCVVGWGASMQAPGIYHVTSSGGLQLGRLWEGAPDPAPVARVLQATAETFVTPNLAEIRWSKLAINCVTATLGAIGGAPLGALLHRRENRRLAMEVLAEVLAVARASGVTPAPVRGTIDIARVAIADHERERWTASLLVKHLLMLAVGVKFRRMRSSMLYALERGREIEIDFLNGEVVSRGAALGVPTPVNRALIRTIREIERKQMRSGVDTLRALAQSSLRRSEHAPAAG